MVRTRVPDPQRCAGCLELVAADMSEGGRVSVGAVRGNGNVVEYVEIAREMRCAKCRARFVFRRYLK